MFPRKRDSGIPKATSRDMPGNSKKSGFLAKDYSAVIFEIITFLIQKHLKTVTVTVILGKLIQMSFKMVIGNQWK